MEHATPASERILHIKEKRICLDSSAVLYARPFDEQSLREDFEATRRPVAGGGGRLDCRRNQTGRRGHPVFPGQLRGGYPAGLYRPARPPLLQRFEFRLEGLRMELRKRRRGQGLHRRPGRLVAEPGRHRKIPGMRPLRIHQPVPAGSRENLPYPGGQRGRPLLPVCQRRPGGGDDRPAAANPGRLRPGSGWAPMRPPSASPG